MRLYFLYQRLSVLGISIHAPLCGGATTCKGACCQSAQISIHAPLYGVRRRCVKCSIVGRYFNPRTPVRGATRGCRAPKVGRPISIHAPLCGVRRATDKPRYISNIISIHAPLCGVRRHINQISGIKTIDFNPRTPVRGATKSAEFVAKKRKHFNPRTPVRGATWTNFCSSCLPSPFQSTHPCAGCDGRRLTISARRRPISIHAPLCGVRRGFIIKNKN